MSEPPNIVVREQRIVDLNFQSGTTGNEGVYIRRSNRIPLPYYILSYTVLPSWNISIIRGWVELYLADNANEDNETIQNRRSLIRESVNNDRVYAHSFYDHIKVETNLLIRREPYIYARMEQTSGLNGAWCIVKVLIPSPTTELV